MDFYKVVDGSFSVMVKPTGYTFPSCGSELAHRRFALVARGNFPTARKGLNGVPNNNVMLQDDDRNVVFTHEKFIRRSVACPHCGTELSDDFNTWRKY